MGNRTVTSVAIILLRSLTEKLDKSKRKCKSKSVGGVGRCKIVQVRSALSNDEDWRSFIDNRKSVDT